MNKLIITIVFFSFSLIAFCQDISLKKLDKDYTYYDINMEKTMEIDKVEYYSILNLQSSDSTFAMRKVFYKNGKMKSEENFSDYKKWVFHGVIKRWDKNGNLYFQCTYEKGKKNGKLLTYWDNGKTKRDDLFKNDTLVEGTCYNVDALKVEHFDYYIPVKINSSYGPFIRYIQKNYRIDNLKQKKIRGKVFGQFAVDVDGTITDIKIVKGLREDCDQEYIRVLSSLNNPKLCTPVIIDGVPTKVAFSLPVQVSLEDD